MESCQEGRERMVKGWMVGNRTGEESQLNVCLQAHKDRACIDGGNGYCRGR